MNKMDACELAYKNGYKAAVDDLQKEFQAITAENKRLKAERDAAVAEVK